MKLAIAKILFEEGYIKSFEEIKEENNQGVIRITLKYTEKGKKVIEGLKRISKPGLRVYASKDELPKVMGGLGVAVISTICMVEFIKKEETNYVKNRKYACCSTRWCRC